MKTLKSASGPFQERPLYDENEIERICESELAVVGLLPTEPEPIRIDRFVEKRFPIVPQFEELPTGVLGFTRFGKDGVEAIVLSRALEEEASSVAERRLRTTLAHEAGHGLLHAHVFALALDPTLQMFPETAGLERNRVLCRDEHVGSQIRGYDGRWWEHQANLAIGALLLPNRLVRKALEPFLIERGSLGLRDLDGNRRAEVTAVLSAIFDVNPIVARIRLDRLFPSDRSQQLTL